MKGDIIPYSEVADRLYEPFIAFRRRLANAYCWSKLAISHDEYLRILQVNQSAFRADFAAELEKAIYTDVELLLIGVVHYAVRIYSCSGSQGARHVDDFGIIGSGYYTAESVLFQRGQTSLSSLSHTLYTLYEAHTTAGDFVPGVSSKFELGVLRYDVESDGLRFSTPNPRGMEFLAKRYEHFGPKELTIADLSDGHVEEKNLLDSGFLLRRDFPAAAESELPNGEAEKTDTARKGGD